MAEIGLIASIAGVTAIGLALSQTIYKAIQGAANAPDAVRGLDKEIRIICAMLDALTESLNDGAKVPPGMPDIIDQLGDDLRRLSAIVERHLPVRANAMRQVFSQVKWMTHTGEVNHLRARIGRYRELLLHSVTITNGTEIAIIRRGLTIGQQSSEQPLAREYDAPRPLYSSVVRGHEQQPPELLIRPYDAPRPLFSSIVRGHQQPSTIFLNDDRIMDISPQSRSALVKNEYIEKMEQSEDPMMIDSEGYLNVLPSQRQETFIRRLYTKVMTDRLPL